MLFNDLSFIKFYFNLQYTNRIITINFKAYMFKTKKKKFYF